MCPKVKGTLSYLVAPSSFAFSLSVTDRHCCLPGCPNWSPCPLPSLTSHPAHEIIHQVRLTSSATFIISQEHPPLPIFTAESSQSITMTGSSQQSWTFQGYSHPSIREPGGPSKVGHDVPPWLKIFGDSLPPRKSTGDPHLMTETSSWVPSHFFLLHLGLSYQTY